MANVDGKWSIVTDSPLGNETAVFELKADGTKLTGTASFQGESQAIQDGTVDGDDVSWKISITTPFPMTLDYKMTVSGTTMSGKVTAGSFGTFDASGTKE